MHSPSFDSIPSTPATYRQPSWRRMQIGLNAICAVAVLAATVPAQVLAPRDPRAPAVATPEQDDATLHDVQFVGTEFGVAVGDRGTTWRTVNGGRSWEFRPTPVTASLRSVCMLTDQVGWAAGIDVSAGTRIISGVLLATQDGGRSWKRVDDGTLPGIAEVRFFDLEHGCIAGASTVSCSSGVHLTDDGGRSWSPVQGARSDGWTAAAFIEHKSGTLVGARDQMGTLGNGRLLPQRRSTGLRGLRDVVLTSDGRGWMVGDGGTLRSTTDGGVSWPPPPALPPREARELQDFTAVAAVGDQVWVAGDPGSVIWQSSDNGLSWRAQPSGDAVAIRGLTFANESVGCAVGLFGSIRMTWDGGTTWTSVRGQGRRPAILAIHARSDQPSMEVVVRESAENGYRSLAFILTRGENGAAAETEAGSTERLRAGFVAAGGNDVSCSWRFPLDRPDIDRQRGQLVEQWSQLHEQRLAPVMLGGLVAAIRTYRPEVLLIDEPTSDDAVSGLLAEALAIAIDQAADPTRYPEQRTHLGLSPWEVPKVFCRTPQSQAATLAIDPHQVLPRLRTTVEQAASAAASRLMAMEQMRIGREYYQLTRLSTGLSERLGPQGDGGAAGRSFFAGLALATGAEYRRDQPPLTEIDDEQLALLARHQRNFAAYSAQLLQHPASSGQLIAQLREATAPLPANQAAQVLVDLAREYRERAQWEFAEETLIELVERYPDQPAAHEALQWLLSRWTSQEVLWQRLRAMTSDSPQQKLNPQILLANFEQAAQAAQAAENSAQAALSSTAAITPLETTNRQGSLRVGNLREILDQGQRNLSGIPVPSGTDQLSTEIARRWTQANRVSRLMERLDPSLFAQPEVQFVRAALLRGCEQPAEASEIYRRFFGFDEGVTPWNLAARGEIWVTARGAMSPKPVLRCQRAEVPPVLDGLLNDSCWAAASEVELTVEDSATDESDPNFVGSRTFNAANPDSLRRAPGGAAEAAIVMLSYDDKYLYLAGSVPRSPTGTTTPVKYAGRQHDTDLATFDRLRFAFDIDRDYTTWYRFDVDQRGATSEALWDDSHWNPQWFVAADAGPEHWRIEVAIPLEELTPKPPSRGDVWAAGITRVIPAEAIQGWTHPARLEPQGETFGLVQFD